MATRSDHVRSYQFASRRVVAALALRDPDAASPARRLGGAVLAGLVVGALALAAVGVYGMLRPSGGDSWREGGSVIIERESGARFVYLDGRLHPVSNYSSALLILGTPDPPSAHVPRAELLGTPRGEPLGIPGAPDLLPAPAELLDAPWTVCSRPPDPSAGSPNAAPARETESVLLVGSVPPGPVASLEGRALLARAGDGSLHLVWHSRRYPIIDQAIVLAAFGWDAPSAVPVASEVLNALPVGAALGRVEVPRTEAPSAVPGLRVGEVYVVQTLGGTRKFGVALAEGLADITQVQADLLIAAGANGLAGPRSMSQAQFASALKAPSLVPTSMIAPPSETPKQVAAPAAVCVAFAGTRNDPQVLVTATAVRVGDERRLVPVAGDLVAPVDWIFVPAGHGAVVQAGDGAVCLVTDLGRRYPVVGDQTLAVLGYGTATPLKLPAALVALLPAERALEPAAARRPL